MVSERHCEKNSAYFNVSMTSSAYRIIQEFTFSEKQNSFT